MEDPKKAHPNSADTDPAEERAQLKPEPVARAELHHFVYDFDSRFDGIPKRVDPRVAESFLRDELSRSRPFPGPAARMAEIADFYDLRGILPEMIKHLDRREKTADDLASSLAFTQALGLLGDAQERAFGRGYYHYLLSLPQIAARMPEVIDTYAAYAPEETLGLTLGRIDEILASLQARAPTEPGARTAELELEDLRNGRLARAEAATKLKAEILATRDAAARLDQLVSIYLDLDMRYYEFMRRWAVRIVLREARAGGGEALRAALRRAVERLGGGAALDPTSAARRSRALRAIEFLGGPITPGERQSLGPPARLFDLVSYE